VLADVPLQARVVAFLKGTQTLSMSFHYGLWLHVFSWGQPWEVTVLVEFPSHIFVYGTLRRGGVNDINRLSPSPRFMGIAQVAGRLVSLGDYPGIQLGKGGYVVGEVYAISAELEMVLDHIEGLSANSRWPIPQKIHPGFLGRTRLFLFDL
jgi:gamma-glutamylcyclotransferase (GGCT)/AIG2-like uncharacterized protein YtfP